MMQRMMMQMGFNLGRSISVFNTLRLTPGKMTEDLKRKFRLIITGSKDWSNAFLEVLSTGVNIDAPADEKDKQLREFIDTVSLPEDEEDCRAIKSDMIICAFNLEDATEDNLSRYKTIFKLRQPAICFIEEPASEKKKDEIKGLLDYLFVSGVEWIPAPTEETIKEKADLILGLTKKYDVSMAYRFPVLRETMAKKLIHDTGMQNMIIALASSLPTNLPIIGIIIGLLAVAGETTVLTVNQLKLCMQIAGIYGMEMNLMDRIRELWPLVGTAIGFRTIARSLAGFIPLAGPTIKGAIGYGGTQLVGETARWYYQEGKKLTNEEKKKIYEDAKENALKAAQKYVEKLKKTADKKDKEDKSKKKMDFDNIEDGIQQLEDEISKLEEEMKEDMDKTLEKYQQAEERCEEEEKAALVKEEPCEETASPVVEQPEKLESSPEKEIHLEETIEGELPKDAGTVFVTDDKQPKAVGSLSKKKADEPVIGQPTDKKPETAKEEKKIPLSGKKESKESKMEDPKKPSEDK